MNIIITETWNRQAFYFAVTCFEQMHCMQQVALCMVVLNMPLTSYYLFNTHYTLTIQISNRLDLVSLSIKFNLI